MKLPSVSAIIAAAVQTFRRFPFVIVIALTGTVAAVLLADRPQEDESVILPRIYLAAFLGLSFLTGIALFAERGRFSRAVSLLLSAAGVLLLGAYAFWLPDRVFSGPEEPIIRFCLLLLAAHLFVSFAPFTRRESGTMEFWQFNKAMFLRALTSGLFAFVLYGGLSIALAAVNNLFEVNMRPERYLQLFACVTGMFMTWFFLSGVPRPEEKEQANDEYPRGLRIFTQYVLLPMVVVYLAILYVYMGKIIVTWTWPHGWVANLVLGFSITGVFSLLLLHPIRDRTEYRWIRVYARWFYFALVPLVGLLLVAIWRRVSEYGLTENRYFVVLLGAWLAGLVVATIATKGKHIRMIPVSLCVLAVASAFGPWSAFAVSERSQRGRLEEIIVRNGLQPGETGGERPSGPVPFQDAKEASSITRYLLTVHGVDALQPLFKKDLRTALGDSSDVPGSVNFRTRERKAVELLGLPYVHDWQMRGSAMSFAATYRQPIDLAGYTLLYKKVSVSSADSLRKIGTDPSTMVGYLADEGTVLVVGLSRQDTIRLPLVPVVNELERNYSSGGNSSGVPGEMMTIVGQGEKFRVRVNILDVRLQRIDNTMRLQSLTADLFLGFSSP